MPPTPRPLPARVRPAKAAPRWQIIFLAVIFGGGLLSWVYQAGVAVGGRRPAPSEASVAPPAPVRSPVPPAPAASARPWYQGGTLHDVSLLTWRGAEPANKLATAADWLAATRWKGRINTPRDLARIRAAAARLVGAVDTVAANPRLDYENTGAVAGALIAVSSDLGP